MTSRYGMYHLAGVKPEHVQAYEQLKPAWVVVLNPEMKDIKAIRQASPSTKIAGRLYRSDSDYASGIANNPGEYAKGVARDLKANPVYRECDLAITSNEVGMDWKQIGNLNAFYTALQDNYPQPLGLYSTPVESVRWDREPYEESLMAYMAQLQGSMTQGLDHGDIYCAHQYNAPLIWRLDQKDRRPQDNLNYNRVVRYEQHIWPRLSSKLQKLPVLMSEWGYDFLTWPTHRHGGWLDPDGPPTVEDALHDILKFTNNWDSRYHNVPVVGWIFYCVGDSGGWGKYQADKPKGGGATLLETIAKHLPGGDWPKPQNQVVPAGEHRHQPKAHTAASPTATAAPDRRTLSPDELQAIKDNLQTIDIATRLIRTKLGG